MANPRRYNGLTRSQQAKRNRSVMQAARDYMADRFSPRGAAAYQTIRSYVRQGVRPWDITGENNGQTFGNRATATPLAEGYNRSKRQRELRAAFGLSVS